MKYGVHSLARIYAKGFYKFLEKYKIKAVGDSLFSLFNYAIKSICDLEVYEYNSLIRRYGDKCIGYLLKLKNTPHKLENLSLEERTNLVGLSSVYVVVINQSREVENV